MSAEEETRSDGDGIECPHCRKVFRDLWDYEWSGAEDESAETECGWCGEPITLFRDVYVSYRCKVRP